MPEDHPLRQIKKTIDEVLKRMSPLFDSMYAELGAPSIPPERLLKAKVLSALYSVRSDRLFCQMLKYNMLFLWFLDMDMTDEAWDASTFSKNQERLLQHDVGQHFFAEIVDFARESGLASADHFTVDGTLIDAWASMKSFVPKEKGSANKPDNNGDGSNQSVNFHGQKRSNQTHESTTDPQARLMRKGKGKEARLSFGAHALMENRNGLLMEIKVTSASEVTEGRAATEILEEQSRDRFVNPKTVGADKGYHNAEFVRNLRAKGIRPHIAPIKNRQVPGLDGRTTGGKGYQVSQRVRKRVEEVFGWMKTVGGFRKTRYHGTDRTQIFAYWVGSSYNLLRIGRLQSAPT